MPEMSPATARSSRRHIGPERAKSGRNARRNEAPSRITERSLLRILVAGFSLVILLLVAAGVIGLRNAHTMHQSIFRLSNEQRIATRLLEQVQLEQNTMSDVFFRLLRQSELAPEDPIFQGLDQFDDTVEQLRQQETLAENQTTWQDLIAATQSFSALARSLSQTSNRDTGALEMLFERHQRVQQLTEKLMLANSRSAMADERTIAAQANSMITISLSLLGACLALAILCAGVTVRFAASSLHKLEEQANELNRVSWQMLQGQEEAARRFSHELHDELGQSLAAVKANLMTLSAEDFRQRRGDCIHLVDESISNVRDLSQLLRPVILDDFGLDAALRWLCDGFQQRTRIGVDYQSTLTSRLPERAETQLFRITQEALTNIARHSGASHVNVSLQTSNGRILLQITDNGKGLAGSNGNRPGLGLVGMRARAVQAGGSLAFTTPAGGGLDLLVDLPLEHVTDDATAKDSDSLSG